MTKASFLRSLAVCALAAPALHAQTAAPVRLPTQLSLYGPREDLPWHRHDALWNLTGKEWTSKTQKPWEQEAYVIPSRPGKNVVRYFDFHWRDFDYLDDDGSAGIRFYYYDREYPVARIAAGLVRQSWAYLSDRFNYKPSFKVPYILYNTYREFLETNVFDVQEGTLGVTSPQDLRMTLSYSGDRQLFTEVSTHEMVHQFHIQKVAERAASAGLDSPIGAFPLWFIEGLAEYYAHGQTIDPETDMFLRDVVLNPNGEIGYDIPSLEEDRPYAFLYTYKYGQAKLVFLAETYGEKVIQAVLDQSPRLGGGGRRSGGDPGGMGGGAGGFMGLLARIAGEQPQQMNARWQEWMRKRAYPTFLQSKQDLPDVTELRLPDELDWFVSSRDGNLIFYRGVERDTGRAKLVLIDRRDPSSHKQIAIDQHPGTESLHPVMRSVMAVCETAVAWFAQSGDSDVLHVRTLNRVVKGLPAQQAPYSPAAPPRPIGRGRYVPSTFAGIDASGQRAPVDLNLGPDREIEVVRDGIIEAGDPAFSPDCSKLAFYGLDRDGKSDIYTFDLQERAAHSRRLTEDLYAERDLSWGEDGILYAGDATESGRYNLFRIDPQTGTRERLTDSPVNQRHPVALAGGALLFDSEAGGKNDLWFLQDGRIKRLTDFTTALAHPGLAPNGIYGVAWYGARFRMMEVPSSEMLAVDEQDAIPPSYASTLNSPLPFPDEPIPENAPVYEALDLGKNWRLEGGGAAVGGVGIGLAPVGGGGVIFADVLRDRSFLANLAIYGSFDLTDALAFYVDRSNRLVYGVGAFNTFQIGRDIRFPGADCTPRPFFSNVANPPCEIFYLQRMFGAQGLVSYPFSTFSRVDAMLRVQGMSRSLLDNGIVDVNGFSTNLPVGAANSVIGFDSEVESSVAYGWDTTRYGPGGAIGGSSLLFTLGAGSLPQRGADGLFAYTQADGINTIGLFPRTKITTRAALGYAQGNQFGRHFFLSSFDNLRGFRFNDRRLLGDAYYVAQAELAFPLDFLIRFAFFSGITGIVGVDFGGVVESALAQQNYPNEKRIPAVLNQAWANRTFDYVLGVNFGLGPFELRVHFAHGVDIGGIVPERDDNGNPTWVPNISLHYAYF